MASNFPKLPGFVVTHNPCMVNHKKMSHVKLDQVRNGNNVDVPLYAVPLQPSNAKFTAEKTDMSKSMSQKQYVNHQGTNIDEQYEPNFVKLDKQVITHPHIFHKWYLRNKISSICTSLNQSKKTKTQSESQTKENGFILS